MDKYNPYFYGISPQKKNHIKINALPILTPLDQTNKYMYSQEKTPIKNLKNYDEKGNETEYEKEKNYNDDIPHEKPFYAKHTKNQLSSGSIDIDKMISEFINFNKSNTNGQKQTNSDFTDFFPFTPPKKMNPNYDVEKQKTIENDLNTNQWFTPSNNSVPSYTQPILTSNKTNQLNQTKVDDINPNLNFNFDSLILPPSMDLNPLNLDEILNKKGYDCLPKTKVNTNFMNNKNISYDHIYPMFRNNFLGSMQNKRNIYDVNDENNNNLNIINNINKNYRNNNHNNNNFFIPPYKINSSKSFVKRSKEKNTNDYHKTTKREKLKFVKIRSTKICRNWDENGICKLGENCNYSHYTICTNLRKRVTNYKTKPCVDPARGFLCQYQENCNFAHPSEPLRRPMPIEHVDQQYFTLLLRDCPGNRFPFGIFV